MWNERDDARLQQQPFLKRWLLRGIPWPRVGYALVGTKYGKKEGKSCLVLEFGE